jgi:hypothetical protein
MPELISEIANRGHEVASLGYQHRTIKVSFSRKSCCELIYRADHNAERRIDLGNPLHKGVSMFPGSVDGWMGNNHVAGAAVVGNRLIFFGRQGKGYDFYRPNKEYTALTGGLEDPYGYKCGPYEAVMWICKLDALKKGDRSVVHMTFPWASAFKVTCSTCPKQPEQCRTPNRCRLFMLCAFAEQIRAAALAHHARADGYPVLGAFTYPCRLVSRLCRNVARSNGRCFFPNEAAIPA